MTPFGPHDGPFASRQSQGTQPWTGRLPGNHGDLVADTELRLPTPSVAWLACGLTLASTAAYLLGGDALRAILLPAFAIAAIVAFVVSVTWISPRIRWPWYSIAGAGVLFMLGAALRTVLTGPNGQLTSLVPDSFTLPGYAIFGVALAGLLHSRKASQDM